MHAVRCSVGVAEGQSRVWTGQHKVTLLQDRAPLGFKPLLRKLQQSLCISALLLPLKTSQTDGVVDYNRWINQSVIISREGLILTLSILPCQQGRIF